MKEGSWASLCVCEARWLPLKAQVASALPGTPQRVANLMLIWGMLSREGALVTAATSQLRDQ